MKVEGMGENVLYREWICICLILLGGSVFEAQEPKRNSLESRRILREEIAYRTGVERSLSKEMSAEIQALPVFGEIQWTVKSLPFIDQGPHGGISGMGMAEVGGKVYMAGGFTPSGDDTGEAWNRSSRLAYSYDPQKNEWVRLPDLPARREYTRGVGLEDSFLIVGGFSQGSPGRAAAEVFQLSWAENAPQWSTLPPMKVPRSHTAANRVGDLLIVMGGNEYELSEKGYSVRTIRGITEIFDLKDQNANWEFGTPIPGLPRGWSASAVVEGRVYLMGGVTWTEAGRKRLAECLRYDPLSDSWTRLADFPIPISGWAAGTWEKRYLIVIGGAGTRWNDLVFVYDTQRDCWMRCEGSLLTGAHFNDPGVCVIGDTVYVVGAEGGGGSHYNDFLVGKILPASQP